MSFDTGYHSKANQKELKEHLERVVLPKKGRLSEADKLREGDDEFKTLRNKHSGVESAINGLERGGLDVCPDHGIVVLNAMSVWRFYHEMLRDWAQLFVNKQKKKAA